MNLIVTCARHREPDAQEELEDILSGLGDPGAEVSITGMSGILTATTALEPVSAVGRIREMILDEPWSVRHCLRIVPVQRVVRTDLGEIEAAAKEMYRRACGQGTASYRISVEKRNSDLSSREIISRVAGCIKDRVSLESPDRIILVEILGGVTGISVLLDGSDVLSVEKTKRSMSD